MYLKQKEEADMSGSSAMMKMAFPCSTEAFTLRQVKPVQLLQTCIKNHQK